MSGRPRSGGQVRVFATGTSKASNRARLSALILPPGAQRLEPCLVRIELRAQRCLVERGYRRLPLELHLHPRPRHRETLAHRQRRVAPAPALGLALDAPAVGEAPPASPCHPPRLDIKVGSSYRLRRAHLPARARHPAFAGTAFPTRGSIEKTRKSLNRSQYIHNK